MHYILKNEVPIEELNLIEWAKWFQEADRIVKKTTIGDIEVSTVFLGLDRFGDGPPLLFETLIFGGDRDGDMWHYSTWDEAKKDHQKIVAELDSPAEQGTAPDAASCAACGYWDVDDLGICNNCGHRNPPHR